ncbi:hypothetical protein HGRIS_014332 [Hohenbuehelia grisea]|uniref:AB hydrolase-1 domain-containing protein n=1 Tax=Hohenbuehelia grisea TaxID=104357 RepID=A0ABR3JV85_9AGAR
MYLSQTILPLTILAAAAVRASVLDATPDAAANNVTAPSITGRNCSEFYITVDVSAETEKLNVTAPANQFELTDLVTTLASVNVPMQSLSTGTVQLNATYKIWSQLCVPTGFTANGTLEFAIHGINFDHSYWSFDGPGSKYNYVDAALKAGHAIFTYDRLGVGRSSKPNGITEVQISTEIAIAAALVDKVKQKLQFKNIVGIGHSFGSIQLTRIANKYGNLFHGMVLTGFSTNTQGLPATTAGFGLEIASQQNPLRFGKWTSSSPTHKHDDSLRLPEHFISCHWWNRE